MPELYSQVLDLKEKDVFLETEVNDSSYFSVTGIPSILTYGKHSFSLSFNDPDGQPLLKNLSTIVFEFVDSRGTIIFSDILDISELSGAGNGFVWIKKDPLRTADEIADGPAYLYVMGELGGEEIPEEWRGVYNIRSTFLYDIRKDYPNSSALILESPIDIQTNLSISESIELDDGDDVFKRSFINVNLSNLKTNGGKVDSVELSYNERDARTDDFRIITTYPLSSGSFEVSSSFTSGLNPLTNTTKIPIPKEFRRNTPVKFRLRFVNPTGQLAQYLDENRQGEVVEVTSSFVTFEGAPIIIEREDNLLSGSMYTGNAVGKGFEQSGRSSAYLKTVDYEGFVSASAGSGSAGIMFFSGSVLPDSGDNYGGVGLELHGGKGSGSFRFRTNPSLLEIQANTFFVGSENTQFISGSGGTIEISSSDFHLTPEGQVTASAILLGSKADGQFLQFVDGALTVQGSITADSIRTPSSIGGAPSTDQNASSSINVHGFATFKSASIGGFTISDSEISSSGLLLKSSGEITSSATLIGNKGAGQFLQFSEESLTVQGDITANAIRTPASIGGAPSTAQNASSSIDSQGFASFKSASIAGFTINPSQIKSTDSSLILNSDGRISGSAVLLGDKSGGNFLQFQGSTLTVQGDITANSIKTPSTINGSASTIANASASIDSSGNVIFRSGSIAGWKIFGNTLSGSNATLDADGAALYKSNQGPGSDTSAAFDILRDEYYIDFTPADQGNSKNYYIKFGPNFAVDSEGILHASGAVFQGTISASAGLIGGFNTSIDSLSSTNIFISGSPAAGGLHDDRYMFISTSNFNVKQNGDITGSSALFDGNTTIGGTLTVNGTGEIAGFGLTSNAISSSNDNLILKSSGQITGSDVLFSGGKIADFSITSTQISDSDGDLILKSNGQITASAANIIGTVTSTAGAIGGFDITDTAIKSTNNAVELSSALAGLFIKDGGGTNRVIVKSGSLGTVGGGTQYIENKSFEDDSISAGRNFVSNINSWSFSEGGSVNISLTDRSSYPDDEKAVSGDVTLDVVVPAGSGNYSSPNTYEISQVITASSNIAQGDTISFSSVARFSSSFGGRGKDRALGPQYFRLEYSGSDTSGFVPFLPANEFTASNGYGEYFLGSGQYSSFGASADLPGSAKFIKVIITGSINDDTGFTIEKPLFAGDKGTVNSDISGRKFTKTVVGSTTAEFPETEITFDNFSVRSNTRRVELTEDGLLIYNSEDSFIKMSGAGIELRGGSGLASFGSSINRESFTNDSQVAGTLGAPALQPYTADPEDIGTTASDGNVAEFAKGNHVHRLTFSTINSILNGNTVTNGVWNSGFGSTAGDSISGSFFAPSSSFSTRTTDLENASGSFSSRVTTLENQDIDDDLNFAGDSGTGTIDLDSETLTIAGGSGLSSTASGNSVTLNLDSGILSSSSQIASQISGSLGTNATLIRGLTSAKISGSFTAPSSSFSTRVTNLKTDSGSFSTRITTLEGLDTDDDLNFAGDSGTGTIDFDTETLTIAGGAGMSSVASGNSVTLNLDTGILSSSAQISTQISGSLGTNASFIRGLTSTSVSGSFTAPSSSFSTRVTNLETDSGSFSTRLTTAESELNNTLISSSAQIADEISGSFTAASSSFSSRVTTLEGLDTDDDLAVAGDTGGSLSIDLDSETLTIAGGTGIDTSGNTNTITVTTNDSEIVHDDLSGFVANEHIDHSTVSVIAGAGLTGGGTIAANRTLNIGAGTGIDVAADAISVDVSDFMTNGANNRVLTSTGTDAINAEANLTFDGSTLNVVGNISGSSSSTGSFGRVLAKKAIFTSPFDGEFPLTVLSGNASDYGRIALGTDSIKATIGVAGATNNFFTGTSQEDLVIRADSDTMKMHIGVYDSNEVANIVISNTATTINVDNTAQLTIQNNKISGSATSTGSFGAGYIDNKLGIGTLTPLEKLSIKSGGVLLENGQQITWTNISDGNTSRVRIQGDESQDYIRMRVENNNAKSLALTTTGVGIGNLNPSEKLTVEGDISASGDLHIDGTIQGATEIGGDLTITDATPALTFNDTNEHPSRISGNGSHVTLQADYNNTGAGSRIDFEIDGTNQARLYGPTGDLTLLEGGLVTAGNVSGSATSTGSFGAGFFDDSVGMGVAPGNSNYFLNIEAAQTYAARFKSRKTSSSSAQRTMIMVGSGQTKGAGIYFSGPSSTNFSIGVKEDNKFHIVPGGNDIGDSSPDSVTVDTSGNLEVMAGNISGSVTSTGSFGAGYIDNKLGIGTTSPADSIDIQQTDSVIRFKNTGASNFEGIELYNPSTGNFVASFGSFGNTTNGYIQDSTGNAVIFNSTVWGFAGRVVRIGDAHGGKYGFHHQYNTYRTGFGGILGSAAQATIHISGSGNNIGLYSEGFISGSAESTGSFGYGVIADKLEVNGSQGFTIGNAAGKNRIKTGGSGDNIFQFLKANNSYAGIEAKTLTIAGTGTSTFAGHVSGSSTSTGSFGHLNIAGAGNNVANFQSDNRTLSLKLNDSPPTGDVGVQFRAGASDFLGLAAGGGSDYGIVIDDSNNVGIGRLIPNSMLHVDGGDIRLSTNKKIYFHDTNDYNYLHFHAGRLTLGYTADAIQIDMNGSSVKTIEMQANSDFRLLGKNNKKIILEPQGTGVVEVLGNISGSSTSTGSFGHAEILGSPLPSKVGANTLNISKDAVSSFADLQIAVQGNDLMGMVMHEDGSSRAGVYYQNTPLSMLVLRTNSSIFRVVNATNTFSGSSSSTGSFGKILQNGQEVAVGQSVGTTDSPTFTELTLSGSLKLGTGITVNHTVTESGGNFIIDGVTKPALTFVVGNTYVFTMDSSVMSNHPFRIGTSANGSAITDGVTITSTSLTIVVSASTPKSLFYFCTIHSGMGNSISVNEIPIVLDGNTGNITATGNISGSSTSTGSFGTVQSTTATIPTLLGNTTVDATPNANFTVKDTGSNPIRLQLNNASSTSNFQALEFLDSSGTEGYIRYTHGDDEMTFAGKGTAGVMLTLDSSGNAIFAGSKISGSATSTGSFGRGFIDDKLSVGTTAADYNLEIQGDFKLSNISSGFNVSYDEGNNDGWRRGIYFNVNSNRGFHFKPQNPYSYFSLQDHSGHPILFSDPPNRRIGMGTETPTEKLHVVGNIFATGNISGSSTSTGSFGSLFVKDGVQTIPTKTTFTQTQGIELINTGNNTVFLIPSSGGFQIGTFSNKPMVFYTNNTEAGRFDTSQNFLPAGNVSGSSTSTGSFGRLEVLGGGNATSIRIKGDDGSGGHVDNSNTYGIIDFDGLDDNGDYITGAQIKVAADSPTGAGDMPSRIQFFTRADGGSLTEAYRINDEQRHFFYGRGHFYSDQTYFGAEDPDGENRHSQIIVKAGVDVTGGNTHRSAWVQLRNARNSSGTYNYTDWLMGVHGSGTSNAPLIFSNSTSMAGGSTYAQSQSLAIYPPGTHDRKVDVYKDLNVGVDDTGGNLNVYGNISGSASSTGSFGDLRIDGKIGVNKSDPAALIEAWGTDASIVVTYSGNARGGIAALQSQRIALASTTSADDLVFGYSGNPISTGAFTERMRIDNGTGNVGIGTTSPDEKLHIQGNVNGNVKALIENTNTNTSAYATLAFQSDENHSVPPAIFLNGSNNTNYAGANSLNMYQNGNFPLGFVTNNSIRMVVTGTGNVGIGTTSPDFKLQVDGTIAPESDDSSNLGSASLRWADVFAVQTTTGGVFETGLRTEKIGDNPTGTIVSWRGDGLVPCDSNEDELVMGVIKQGKDEPIVMGAEPVLVTGKVDVGDYIVTSDKIGHGKSVKRGYLLKKDLFGKVIAQALEPSDDSDSSLIKCMIRKM